MFEIMNGATGNVLAVRATGKLSAADTTVNCLRPNSSQCLRGPGR
jgi:hypothetical protein